METMFFILMNLFISFGVYLFIALVLIAFDKRRRQTGDANCALSFEGLKVDDRSIPPLEHYRCRDGSKQRYRYYASNSKKVLILLHGSGWHSRYFFPLAEYLSREDLAHVYTPDLRGHGIETDNRGDIDYIGQLEDDVADLISSIKDKHPKSEVILGGHSSGAGLAIRFAGSRHRKSVDRYLLLTPYLKYNAQTMRPDAGDWASVHLQRIIGLVMLNNLGFRWLNSLPVIDFNMPHEYRDGTETLTYSYRLNTGYAPTDYRKDLALMTQPALVIAGENDESFHARKFKPEMTRYKHDIETIVVENETHMGVVMGDSVRPVIRDWLPGRF